MASNFISSFLHVATVLLVAALLSFWSAVGAKATEKAGEAIYTTTTE